MEERDDRNWLVNYNLFLVKKHPSPFFPSLNYLLHANFHTCGKSATTLSWQSPNSVISHCMWACLISTMRSLGRLGRGRLPLFAFICLTVSRGTIVHSLSPAHLDAWDIAVLYPYRGIPKDPARQGCWETKALQSSDWCKFSPWLGWDFNTSLLDYKAWASSSSPHCLVGKQHCCSPISILETKRIVTILNTFHKPCIMVDVFAYIVSVLIMEKKVL